MKNNYIIKNDIVYIELNRRDGTELFALIDKEDLSRLNGINLKWFADYNKKMNCFYCKTSDYKNKNNMVKYGNKMHRFILDYFGKLHIDHINHNTLDNRKCNLRIVTVQENMFNLSNVKGYFWDKTKNKYLAYIYLNKKRIYLGRYSTEVEARNAYINAKPMYHIIEKR
jgi:hypothetical protein